MLQICSGKLFQKEVDFQNKLRGVLYTNLRFFRETSLETPCGTLIPTSSLDQLQVITYELKERIEATGAGLVPGVVTSYNINSYILDFSAILTLALNCTASPNYRITDRLLNEQSNITTHSIPRKIVKQIFDKEIVCREKDEKHLLAFTKQLMGLHRCTYIRVMRSIRTYTTAIQRIPDDFELAYTLLIASIESLAQDFDGHKASWADYDQKKRKVIDTALNGAEESTVKKVKDAILSNEHVSLGRRFKNFIIRYIEASFYREEAIDALNPISKYDLDKALSNAYQARSQHIHNLRKLPDLVTYTVEYSETSTVKKQPWLTIQGLSRLVRHVITNFVMQQHQIEKEPYDYSREIIGVIQIPIHARHWVGDKSLQEGYGCKQLEGLLQLINENISNNKKPSINNLTKLLSIVEDKVDTLKMHDKLSFIALYFIYNKFVNKSERMNNSERFIRNHEKSLLKPSAEALVVNLFYDYTPNWEIEDYHKCVNKYFKERNNSFRFRCPKLIESGILLQLAERYRLSGAISNACDLIQSAVENFPGNSQLQNFENAFRLQKRPIDWKAIFFNP